MRQGFQLSINASELPGAEDGALEQHDASDTYKVCEEVPRESSVDSGVRYVASYLRACLGGESEELSHIRRRV